MLSMRTPSTASMGVRDEPRRPLRVRSRTGRGDAPGHVTDDRAPSPRSREECSNRTRRCIPACLRWTDASAGSKHACRRWTHRRARGEVGRQALQGRRPRPHRIEPADRRRRDVDRERRRLSPSRSGMSLALPFQSLSLNVAHEPRQGEASRAVRKKLRSQQLPGSSEERGSALSAGST